MKALSKWSKHTLVLMLFYFSVIATPNDDDEENSFA